MYSRKQNQKPLSQRLACRDHSKCPLDNKCLTSGVIYQATVTRQDIGTDETYIGLTENTFKPATYSAHMSNFRNENNRYSTTLSEYVWMLQDKKKCHITLSGKSSANQIHIQLLVKSVTRDVTSALKKSTSLLSNQICLH